MVNWFSSIISLLPTRPATSEKTDIDASNVIALTNISRLRLMSVVIIVIEIFLIITIDLHGYAQVPANLLWIRQSYLILHALLIISSLFTVCITSAWLTAGLHNPQKVDRFFTPLMGVILLTLVSLINTLDQISNGQIIVLMINMLAFSAILLIRFPTNLLVFSIPFAIFICGIFYFRISPDIARIDFINASICYFAVLVNSKYVYDSHYSNLIKNSQLEEANQQLAFLSSHDGLTGLANRRNFDDQVEREIALIRRYNQKSSIVLIDIDHFKSINDDYGHLVGDRVLQEFGKILKKNIRDIDLAARWGGEEFILLITQTPVSGAVAIARRIQNTLQETSIDVDALSIKISASFGIVSLCAENNLTVEEAYRQVDLLLYQAKINGRNQIVTQ